MSAANFAPYQPPPDERLAAQVSAPSSSRSSAPAPAVPHSAPPPESVGRASVDSDLDPRYATESYQSSIPSSNQESHTTAPYKQSFQSAPAWAQQPLDQAPYRPTPHQGRPDHLSYSTAQGWNLSNLCFAAWALPPFSSVILLIVETENVRLGWSRYEKRRAEELTFLVRLSLIFAGSCPISCLSVWLAGCCICTFILDIEVVVWMVHFQYHCGDGLSGLLLDLRVSLLAKVQHLTWIANMVLILICVSLATIRSSAANSAPTLARSPFLAYVGPLAEQWVGEE
jgi:hypothetical protein